MENFIVSPTLLKSWPILVIDDEPDSLLVAQRLLKKCGAEVSTASNGKIGLQIATEKHPRFILTDLSMPEMSGWEMLFELKKTPGLAETPVIALSAHAMPGDRERALAAGFHNYLTKPLKPETFIKDLLELLVDIPSIDRLLHVDA